MARSLLRSTTAFPYKRGEFLPWLIPRELMPQIDNQSAFRNWASSNGWQLLDEKIDPWAIVCRQRVSIPYAKQIPDWKMMEPGIISADSILLDGNHRWLKHLILLHQPISIIRFPISFSDAIHTLEEWSGTKAEPATIGGASSIP